MKVRLHFIPRAVANYFDLEETSSLEFSECAKYGDLMNTLEKRFGEASKGLSCVEDKVFPDSFLILSDGESMILKLNEPIKSGEEINVIMRVLGG